MSMPPHAISLMPLRAIPPQAAALERAIRGFSNAVCRIKMLYSRLACGFHAYVRYVVLHPDRAPANDFTPCRLRLPVRFPAAVWLMGSVLLGFVGLSRGTVINGPAEGERRRSEGTFPARQDGRTPKKDEQPPSKAIAAVKAVQCE